MSQPLSDQPALTLPPAPEDRTRRDRRVIRLLLAATFVVILNETIMSVALSELMADLDITARAAQWLSTAFMLTMAVVIPITGFLLQRFNTRPVYTTAMALFSAGTLLAGLAPGFEVLLLGRIVQATGTAIMMPLLMTTLMTLVPPAQRGKTMGNVSIVISVAPAIGPTISGVILNTLSWRWMFWLVLPIAVAMLVIGARRVENVTDPRPVPLDVASVILAAVGFGGLVYGLSTVGEGGGHDGGAVLPVWAAAGAGGAALLMFVLRQLRLQRHDGALLDLRTFKAPAFSIAVGLMTVSMAALFGTIILLPIFLQQVMGLEPVQIGLMLLPGGLLMGLLAPAVGRRYDRSGPTVLVVPGTVLVSAVLWFLSTMNQDTPVLMVLAAHLVLSLGLALLFTPLFTAGLGAVRPELYSHGSAIVGTVQQVAGAAGTALFVTVMSVQSAALAAGGQAGIEAVAGGVQAAFLTGALISLPAIAGAFFIRKPAEQPVAAGHH
ncbi:DHA2 family efflux MFS transporter permease subunit [Arthrobacter mobilis]|uniref:DHA2 family efflux MFS transporter permease subunit n=1 Tax=Arthrobacter mobilis TaxID=2724944 RepID=UPI0035E43489